jgi:hypothetical protein
LEPRPAALALFASLKLAEQTRHQHATAARGAAHIRSLGLDELEIAVVCFR